ncbi:FAD-binding oxidoreductase [Rhodovulum sp. BSW8]|uniref:FAD-binding oxidoreductase n=1 Tax=Rhodovulum visakhapatnamense TaxID=364297 RepID=A0A4R8FJ08_9RHOB|nr:MULTISPECIES: FAD-binding oxidoreductase [Rhodovulum]OLS43603.1 D-amino-acid oxidase [Rhodovulum sulfidophilum]MBL3569854.1 FAD-binding oxidoreductase [Rhodovulum visakhapatnamense]MBL3577740.1 FAD-binding oxidoreductase [Rhodovulum visakhapatnamense]RBO51284.1 FAD-binding oxidoreductase [Rhodovulum sp. BSW8]TDX26116.1 glycine/D-amino acid oxidase-like deaminating enzyme [Rhodovulum visakhapatnamense]
MPAPLHRIETPDILPESADCVVIGAGIVGVSAAYWLAAAGQKVVLLEKGLVGAEQSSRNWGWCRQQNRDARELPLATRSLELWERMTVETGVDLGFRRSGLLYLSNDPAEIEGWADWGRFARGAGIDTRMLSAAEAAERGAATGKSWAGGVWSPTDGIADPARAAPMIATGVTKLGGTVLQNCAARGIEREAGAVSGVITEKGVIRTRQVVLAGGAWAASFLHQLGLRFPQASVRSSILSLAPGGGDLPAALHTAAVSVTRRGDGGHTLAISGKASLDPTPGALMGARHFLPMFAKRWQALAPGGFQAWAAGVETRRRWAMDAPTPMETVRILDPRPAPKLIAETLTRARRLLPALKALPVQAEWAGYIDSTPDGVPVIDGEIGVPGLLLAAGFSGHGFGIGPGAGHLVADILLGRPPITEIAQYRLARFDRAQWGKVSDF